MMNKDSFYSGLKEEALICASCGYCKVECPVYLDIGWESSSPRAKMAMIRDLLNGKDLSENHVNRIFQCTLCGKCREVCSTHIDTIEAWKHIRENIAEKGKNPENMQMLSSTIREVSNITGDEQINREMWLDSLDEVYKEKIGKKAEVLYYTGCSSSLYPMVYKIPQSFVQILYYANVDFTLLGSKEECCGFPLLGTGEFAKSKNLVKKNIERIKEYEVKVVVTTCSSCYHTLKFTYPKILGKELPFKVKHASQFMEELTIDGKLEFKEINEKVTYHDPCDLGRNSGVFEPPRKVIKSIPEIEFVEMKKSRKDSNCCGGGGNLEALDPELVSKIALRRLNEIQETGARTVISSCQQCKRTLQNTARKNKIRIRVMDLTELVLKALKK